MFLVLFFELFRDLRSEIGSFLHSDLFFDLLIEVIADVLKVVHWWDKMNCCKWYRSDLGSSVKWTIACWVESARIRVRNMINQNKYLQSCKNLGVVVAPSSRKWFFVLGLLNVQQDCINKFLVCLHGKYQIKM